MKHPNKMFATLFMAILALAAVGASAAQAAPEFSAKGYPAFVKGTHVGNVAMTEVGSITCEEGSYQGTLNGQSSTLTLEPKYGKCKEGVGRPVTWFFNGCDYLLHLKERTGENNFNGNFDYACPAGKVIEAKAYSDAGHTVVACRLTIGPQTGLLSVTYTNFKEGLLKRVEMVLKVEKIVFFQEGTGCANGKFEKGVLEGTVKLSAQDAFFNPLELEIVGK